MGHIGVSGWDLVIGLIMAIVGGLVWSLRGAVIGGYTGGQLVSRLESVENDNRTIHKRLDAASALMSKKTGEIQEQVGRLYTRREIELVIAEARREREAMNRRIESLERAVWSQ